MTGFLIWFYLKYIIMMLFDFLFVVIGLYLLIYCIYQLFFSIKANKIEEYFEIQEKTRSVSINKNRLCVIVYVTDNDKADNLFNSLLNQTYDKENYDIQAVYQKTANIEKQFPHGVKVYNIQDEEYYTKDKAVNKFLDEILPEKKYDAYVFLGVDRQIGAKYLENVNRSINTQGVLVGTQVAINEQEKLPKKIKNAMLSAYIKYKSRTSSIVRSMLDLPSYLDGDNLVITSEIMEKMGYVGIEDKNSLLEYSLELAVNNVKATYSPYIITGVDIRNYDFSSPSISKKIQLFFKYFPILIFKSLSFKEFLFRLLRPNSLCVIFSYMIFAYLFLTYSESYVDITFYLISFFLIIDFIVSIKASKMEFKEIIWLIFYPVCLLWQKIKIVIHALTMQQIINSQIEEENINSATINSVVYNGKKNINCKIDLVSEDGMRKVIYREGNKFILTDSYLRMYDALEDLSYKLRSKGLVLKTCQNCMQFTLCPDGTLDCLKGKCGISNNDILIWNGCQYFHLHPEKRDEE